MENNQYDIYNILFYIVIYLSAAKGHFSKSIGVFALQESNADAADNEVSWKGNL